MTRVVIYVRTSKISQDFTRQIQDLREYAIRMNFEIVEAITEKISGSCKIPQREGLQRVMQLAKTKSYDKLLVSEISRLGRTTEVHSIIEELSRLKVSIYIHNYSMETLDNNLMPNSMIGFMLTILAEFSRIEKETLIQRIKSGLEQAKRQGKVLGRKKDTLKSKSQYIAEYKPLIKLVKKGLSLREIATIGQCSINTVRKLRLILTI
jgi:DNA invertase Pin-like site-specific DNA recombinase